MAEAVLRLAVPAAKRLAGQRTAALLMAGPAALLILLIKVFPLAGVFAISLTDWQLGARGLGFAGADNYTDLLRDPLFFTALGNTLAYAAMTVPPALILGLMVALGVSRCERGQAFYQVVYFLPNIAILSAMAVIWQVVLHPQAGPVSRVLARIGIAAPNWLTDAHLALPTLAVIGIWQGVGFAMVFYLAGLKGVDRSLYDAAMIDGAASAWERFWIVTWPQLAPTTLFLLVVMTSQAFLVFESVVVLTQGGPQNSTQVLLYAIYQEGFRFLRANHAAALSVVFLVILLSLTWLQVKLIDKRISYR